MNGRIVWTPETGWTDDGPEASVALDHRGRLTVTPTPPAPTTQENDR